MILRRLQASPFFVYLFAYRIKANEVFDLGLVPSVLI